MGWVGLTAIGITGRTFFTRLLPISRLAVATGISLTLEWHLVWAAASGMETLIFSWVALFVICGLFVDQPKWLLLGFLVGIGVWLRPDGFTLAGPLLFAAALQDGSMKTRGKTVLQALFGILLISSGYVLFNYLLSGNFWPNTFFAKQAEYAILRQAPFGSRLILQAKMPLIGAGSALLPGFLIMIVHSIRTKSWRLIAAWVWVVGFLILYAIRLPVTYQHGRYIIPIIPVYVVLSLFGVGLSIKLQDPVFWKRVLSRVWLISWIALTIAFYFIGGRAYANDVAVIESEMVETAKWISQNTDPDAVIAAHDIGGLGYFGGRKIVDLAGLVSPEVIPYIRDEKQLAKLLDSNNVDYLMTFPGWYPDLIRYAISIFSTGGEYSIKAGGENMSVYRWR